MGSASRNARLIASVWLAVVACAILGFAGNAPAYAKPGDASLVAAQASDVWDGVSLDEPKNVGGTYQISTGAELAWFAAQVNDGTGASYNAVLTDDVDLGGCAWAPIGNSTSRKFAGSFNGQGHLVSGLSCKVTSWGPAGLFGIVNGGTVSNVVVEGEVSAADFYAVGGIAARIEGAAHVAGCGNLASVTNTSNSGRAAGIVGWIYGTGTNAIGTVTDCFNRGAVQGKAKTAGIVADSEYGASVRRCYNTGSVTGATAYALASATTVDNGYNVGAITGSSAAYAAYGTSLSGLYCLEGTVAGAESGEGVQVITAVQLKAPSFVDTLGSASWQVDAGGAVNGGYPLLAWEKTGDVQAVQLAAPGGLAWLEQDPLDLDGIDIAYEVIQAVWQPVDGASAYRVKLYREGEVQPVFESEAVEDCQFDFFDVFASLESAESARYTFTVTALGDGQYYLDSDESAADATGFVFDGAAFVAAPAQTVWNEASKIAVWSRVDGAEFYLVSLYRGSTRVAEYNLGKDVVGTSGANLSLQFISNMTGTGDYFFTVRAGKTVASGPNAGKRAVSVLAQSAATHYEAAEGETVEIASADDWMRIVNLTHEGTAYATDADAQNVEWAKNYVITADLDFSDLSAEQQVQTKSWGNINAPFQGTLDGQGHVITGLTLANGDNGLFAYIGEHGAVKNLVVEAANVLFNDNAGIFCVNNYGTISNCGVKNTNIASDYSGIIAGFLARNYGLVQDCYVEGGSLTTTATASNGHAGFVGNNHRGLIRRCWTSMDVSTQSFCAGGFAGWSDETYDKDMGSYIAGAFENCFALGDVHAQRGWCGGFVGRVNSSRSTFTNCYAAGTVTASEKPATAHGFFGSMGGEGVRDLNGENASSFYITLPAENCSNCFYCSDRTPQDNPCNLAQGASLAEMRTDEFAERLGLDWERADDLNEGLPYLRDMAVPLPSQSFPMTVQIAVALYDTDEYAFVQEGETVDVTFNTEGNARVIDVMEAAAAQGLIDYDYTVTAAYGSFVESINGHKLTSPDGWMFTVNDDLSDVGVQLASVHDGDQLLWYQGMPSNSFLPPAWQDVIGQAPKVEWVDIATPQDLLALTEPGADLGASYRLVADIDMAGIDFAGIGSYATPFAGVFKGKGYRISNLNINRPHDHNVGLFNFICGAELNNVELKDATVVGDYSVGALVGVASVVLDGSDRAKCVGNLIGGCSATGSVTSSNEDLSATSSGAYAGGLVGFNDGDVDSKTGISVYSSIDRCTADVAVTGQAMYVGGLVGGNYGIVTNSLARGVVTGGDCTGGLFGGNVGSVYDSGATGDVTGAGRTGGFGGDNYNDAIERCYSTGTVRAQGDRIGGFVGDAGGTIRECSSAGAVVAQAPSSYVGGFAGSYTGALTGLYVRITFLDNCGWSYAGQDGEALPAIGSMRSSANEFEQAVLDATQATDWDALRDRFADLHGVVLPETAPEPGDGPQVPDPPEPEVTAAQVQALIDAIGVVQLDADGSLPAATKAALDAARSAYDALDDAQKALVANYGALETAEELYAALVAQQAAHGQDGAGDALVPSDAVASAAPELSSLARVDAKRFKLTVKPKKKTLSLSFAKTSGAINYRLAYRKAASKNWSYAWSGNATSFTLKKLAAGGLYECKVAAFAKKNGSWVRSAWSGSVRCWLAGTKLTLKPGKRSAKVTVGKVKKASGYELRWSAKKTLAKAKSRKLAGASKVKTTIKKLKRGKKTFVQVVPYKRYKGQVYCGAATLKAVKAR